MTSLTPSEPSGVDAADVDLGEIGVGAALGGGHAHLGRGGLVVELDPEALQQLFGLFAGQRAVGQPLLVERDTGAGRGGRGRTNPRCSARWSRPGGRTSSTAALPGNRAGHGPGHACRPRRSAPAPLALRVGLRCGQLRALARHGAPQSGSAPAAQMRMAFSSSCLA